MKLFIILFLPIFIGGCKLDFSLPENEVMYVSDNRPGQTAEERQASTTDSLGQTVNCWLAENPEGWRYAFMTREPHIYLRGQHFSINILKDEVSVKYCRGFYNCHFWVKRNNDLLVDVQKMMQSQ
jgi:hypothetical protein